MALGGALGALGSVSPVLGIGTGIAELGMGIKGYFNDKAAAQEAARRQEQQLDIMRADRNLSRQKYMSELDRDAARRNMVLRGQVTSTPAYQSAMARLGRTQAAQNAINMDNMTKMGLGDRSAMNAQMAAQNLSGMSNATVGALGSQMDTQSRVYGGIQGNAVSSAPETNQYDYQTGIYNQASDYGANLAPLFKLGNTALKYSLGDKYRSDMNQDVDNYYKAFKG